MLEKVKETVKKYKMLEDGDTVLIGVSGGPDSTALVYSLWELRKDYKLNLHIFHLNHQLRGKDAEEDALFVENLGRSLSIPVIVESFDVAEFIKIKKLSLQEGARIIRYSLMEKKAEEIGANKIAIGQNSDDQVETVLMRFLRGTGSKGLGGIPPVREGKFIRPLIEIWREEIEEFLKQRKLEAQVDKSNLKPIYLRNKIRLELIPYLKQEYNPNISKVLSQMSQVFREESNYLEENTANILSDIIVAKNEGKIEVDRVGFNKQNIALQRRMITILWDQITNGASGLSFVHIDQAVKHISEGRVGTKLNLPQGLWLVNDYETFIFGKKIPEAQKNHFSYPLQVPGLTENTQEGWQLWTQVLPKERRQGGLVSSENEVELDYDSIPIHKLVIRKRLPGDVFRPLNGQGSKKLKDYFIDCKVSRQLRDEIPLVAIDNEVLWIVGYSINDKFKVGPTTKNIIRFKLDKN